MDVEIFSMVRLVTHTIFFYLELSLRASYFRWDRVSTIFLCCLPFKQNERISIEELAKVYGAWTTTVLMYHMTGIHQWYHKLSPDLTTGFPSKQSRITWCSARLIRRHLDKPYLLSLTQIPKCQRVRAGGVVNCNQHWHCHTCRTKAVRGRKEEGDREQVLHV